MGEQAPLSANHRHRIDEMLQALDLEIRSQRNRPKAEHTVVATNGRLIDADDGIYSFEVAKWPVTWTRPNCMLREPGTTKGARPAELLTTDHLGKTWVVTLKLGELLTIPLDRVDIAEDATGTLMVLKDRIAGLLQPGAKVCNPTRAFNVMGDGRPLVGFASDAEKLIGRERWKFLNDAQRSATRQALGSDLTYIWGPPGTGKTDVLTSIIEGSFRQGRTVLFVAPTNVAVDQALLRICDRLANEPGFDSGLVQRVGSVDLPEVARRYGEMVDIARIEERMGASLSAAIQREKSQQGDLAAELVHRKSYDQACRRAQTAADAVADNHAKYQAALAEQRKVESLRDAKTDQLQLAQSATGWGAGRKKKAIPELTAEIEAARRSLELLKGTEALWQNAATTAEQRQSAAEAEAAVALAELGHSSRTVAELEQLIDISQQALNRLNDDLVQLKTGIQANARVIATTAAMAVQRRLPIKEIDTVVMDEAGMLDLPTAFYLGGIGARHLVIAGDFRQLPAVVVGDKDRESTDEERRQVELWFARDPFAAGGMVSPSGHIVKNQRLVRLEDQYRMRTKICSVINAVAYNDAPLQTARDDSSRLLPTGLLSDQLIMIDTHDRRVSGSSYTRNASHAAIIREFIRGLQFDGVLPARSAYDSRPDNTIGVIAPYRDQVKYLERTLTERFGRPTEGVVDTVHRFQGSERPLIVVDTVAGAGTKVGPFFDEVGLNSSTCRLLNVALSRAQDHLVVLVDTEFLTGLDRNGRRRISEGSEVLVLLKELESKAYKLSVDTLIPIRAARDLSSLAPDVLARPAFFPADESFKAIQWDIDRATRSIDIHCAFLKGSALKTWLPRFEAAVQRGVTVNVFTRPNENDREENGLTQRLRAAGCTVTQREVMHEKVIIIDDELLWHGSLNLLAHTRSTDLMMRLNSAEECRAVRTIIQHAKPTRAALPVRPEDRLYLNVPFEEKDAAKAIGAKWDQARKKWWVKADFEPRSAIAKWFPEN